MMNKKSLKEHLEFSIYSKFSNGEMEYDQRSIIHIEKMVLRCLRERWKDLEGAFSMYMSAELFEILVPHFAAAGISWKDGDRISERANVMLNEQVFLFHGRKIPIEFVESQRKPVCITSDDLMIMF